MSQTSDRDTIHMQVPNDVIIYWQFQNACTHHYRHIGLRLKLCCVGHSFQSPV